MTITLRTAWLPRQHFWRFVTRLRLSGHTHFLRVWRVLLVWSVEDSDPWSYASLAELSRTPPEAHTDT